MMKPETRAVCRCPCTCGHSHGRAIGGTCDWCMASRSKPQKDPKQQDDQIHRAVHSAEHDPANGRIHGFCLLCGVAYPCEYVGTPDEFKERMDGSNKLRSKLKASEKRLKELEGGAGAFLSRPRVLCVPRAERWV